MCDAANKGIDCASGAIVGMLNADDLYADKDVLKDVANSWAKDSHSITEIFIMWIGNIRKRSSGKGDVSIADRLRANREDRKAWTRNGLRAAWYTFYLEPLSKIGHYLS